MASESLDHEHWYTEDDEAMKNRPGLVRRDGTYIIRRRYPLHVREAISKVEFKVSLGTKDPQEARCRYDREIVNFHREVAAATVRGRDVATTSVKVPIPESRLRALAIEWLRPRWRAEQLKLWKPLEQFETELDDPVYVMHKAVEELKGSAPEIHAGYAWIAQQLLIVTGFSDADTDSIEILGSFMRRGEIDVLQACLRHYDGDTSHSLRDTLFVSLNDFSDDRTLQPASSQSSRLLASSGSPITVNQAIERFLSDPQRSLLSANNAAGYATGFKVLKDVAGANTPLRGVTLAHAQAVQELLSRMPANAKKSYPNCTAQEAAQQAAKRGDSPMQAKTASNVLARLAAFFRWAVDQELVDKPRFNGLTALQPRKSKAESRQPFSSSDLGRLFSDDLYRHRFNKIDSQKAGKYWVPLLALYHGARQNELCQLEASDIVEIDGIHAIRITVEGLHGRTKRLKTASAERTIPVHPVIIELGFLDYCESVRAAGQVMLFEDLTVSVDGSYSKNFSKWFGRYCSDQGLSDSRLNFHSFRHGFVDACRSAQIPLAIYGRIGGWSGAKSASELYGGTETLLPDMAREIKKIRFPSVEKILPILQVVNDPSDIREAGNQATEVSA
jgi:integrase